MNLPGPDCGCSTCSRNAWKDKTWKPTTICPLCDGTGNIYRNDEDGDFLPCECQEVR